MWRTIISKIRTGVSGRTCSNIVFKIWDHIRCLILLHANVTLWITNFVEFPGFAKSDVLSEGKLGRSFLTTRWAELCPWGRSGVGDLTRCLAVCSLLWNDPCGGLLVLYGNKQNAFILLTIKILFINTRLQQVNTRYLETCLFSFEACS
jgi:hypothetical protein